MRKLALLGVVAAALLTVFTVPTALAQQDYPPTTTTVALAPARAATSPARAQLAVTGSSHTPSLVFIGLAALVVGLIVVVAVRRRRHVLDA